MPQVPSAPSDHPDQDEPSPISPPDEHDTPKWMVYYRTVNRILGHQTEPDRNHAMRQAATACGPYKRSHHEQETATQLGNLRSMVNAIW